MNETTDDLNRAKALLVPVVRRIVRHKDAKAMLAEGKTRRR